jgi:hypothetical protein
MQLFTLRKALKLYFAQEELAMKRKGVLERSLRTMSELGKS